MSQEKKRKIKILIAFCGAVLLYVVLQVTTIAMQKNHTAHFNGVFMALQYGLCLFMMLINRKRGIRISFILMGISILLCTQAIFMEKSTNAVSGLCNAVFYLITIIAISLHQRKQEKEAVTDLLTGLINRRGLYKLLREKIGKGKTFHVIYLCLDNFKFINDNYGHAYGDELMRIIAMRMSKFFGEEGQVARIGGAEFAMVIDGNLKPEEAANNLLDVVREKTTLAVNQAKVDCYMTCYAGVSSYPEDATDYEALIKNADIAMYDAMSKKSKTVGIFNSEMAAYITRQVELEKLIKEGIENDYFYLVYQPQYHLDEKKLRGFETLIRMKTPDGVFVSPGEFIPVAEKGDLILQIDDYVLRRAMKEFRDIVEKRKELTISINVSAKNIGEASFIDKIETILEETGFSPENLEIEITEYCMVDSMDVTIENIKKLRAMGIQVALDDFGTGYTSLNYVAKLPINLLKVDKSLVDDIEKDQKSREFVHAVISMGHLMGCEVISEGVEDETQLAYLKEDGCDFVQGYVWGKPLDYEVAVELSLQ